MCLVAIAVKSQGVDEVYRVRRGDLPVNTTVISNVPYAFREIVEPRVAINLNEGWNLVSVPSRVVSETTNANKRVERKYEPVALPAEPKWKTVNVPIEAGLSVQDRSEYVRRVVTVPAELTNHVARLRVMVCTDTFSVRVNGQTTRYDEPTYGVPFVQDIPVGQLKAGENEIVFHFYHRALSSYQYLTDRGHHRGLRGDVFLEFMNPVRIVSTRMETRVIPEKVLIADVVVQNSSQQVVNTTLSCTPVAHQLHDQIRKQNGGFNVSVPVTLAPGETKTVRLEAPWKDVQLWNPDTPNLYYAQFVLGQTDAVRERFGFRHFQIDGHRFLLNGYPFMARSGWGSGGDPATAREGLRRMKARGANATRLFIREKNTHWMINLCDEEGLFVTTCVESNNGGGGWEERQNPKFWSEHRRNAIDVTKAFINNPSVILWGLGCEFGAIYAGEGTWREASLSTNLCANGAAVMAVDPTRTWGEYGGVECGYPVKGPGACPTRSFHYPFNTSSPEEYFPDLGYWYADGRVSWHRIADFKKPTIIPEDCYHGMMDSHMAMTKWANDTIYTTQGYVDAVRMAFHGFAEGYYAGGLALWEPWMTWTGDAFNRLYDNGWQVMPDYLVALRGFATNLRSGEEDARTIFAYNQRFTSKDCELRAELIHNGYVHQKATTNVVMTPGMKLEMPFVLKPFNVKEPTKAEIRVQLIDRPAKQSLADRKWAVTIFPADVPVVAPAGMALVAATHSPLASVNFPKGRFDDVATAVAANPDSIVVARDLTIAEGKRLNDYVVAGGRVLALDLSENSWTPVVYQRQRPLNYIWRRHSTAMPTVEEAWLKSWRGTGYVSQNAIRKGGDEDLTVLFDAGQADGLTAMLVGWLYREKGAWLLCQLPLQEQLGKEPCAASVLNALLGELAKPNTKTLSTSFATAYCDEACTEQYLPPPPPELIEPNGKTNWIYNSFYLKCRTMKSSGPAYNLIFEKAKILRGKDTAKAGVLFVDASAGLTEAKLATIEAAAKAGKTVFVSEIPFQGETNSTLLARFGLKLENPRIPEVHNGKDVGEIVNIHSRGDYPHWVTPLKVPGLLDGLSADDFVWYSDSLPSWGRTTVNDTFWPIMKDCNTSVITAKLVPTADSRAKLLTAPGAIAEVKHGNGTIYFSTLRIRVFSEKFAHRVNFVLRTMLNNLGAKTSVPGKVYEYECVDLSAVMNRNLWSNPLYKKPDGTYDPAGWFDAPNAKETEQNDMRYFPVNLCGWSTTANNYCPKGVFPTEPIDLGGKRFKIVDPATNKGRAVLVLKGDGESATVTLKEPIRCDQLYILAAAQDFEGELAIRFNDEPAEEIYTTREHFNWFRYASTKTKGVTAWVGETVKDATAGLWYWKVPNPKPAVPVKTLTIQNVTKTQVIHTGEHRPKLIAIVAVTAEREAK